MKQLTKLLLVAGMVLLTVLPSRAQTPTGRLYYEGKGDYSIGGSRLTEDALHNLIGEENYYETYLQAQKQRRIGLPVGLAGAGLLVATVGWYALFIDSPDIHESTVVISSAITGTLGLVAGAGLAYYFIGKARLKWIADDYNRRNGYAAAWQLGPAPHGLGLTYSF